MNTTTGDDFAPSSREILDAMGEREVVARTAWGEARGEGVTGMASVIAVIRNRSRRAQWPNNAKAVALQNFQFSLWNMPLDHNGRAALSVPMTDNQMTQALRLYDQIIARGDLSGVPVPAQTADHYHKHTVSPYWRRAMTQTGTVGQHIFYTA